MNAKSMRNCTFICLLGLSLKLHNAGAVSSDLKTVKINSSAQATETSTLPGDAAQGTSKDHEKMEEDRRAASARLKSYIRGLPTSREKVAPTVMDKNGERKVMLQAHVTVLGVLGVDDVQQTVSTTIFLLLYWQDKSLAWNTSAYEGVDKIFLPMDSVWTPSVNLGNTMSATDVVRSAGNLEVDSEGRAKVQLPLFIETLCSLDLTHYPYDEQVCTILIYTFLEDLEWDAIESSRSDSEQLANALDIGSEWEMVNTSVELTVVSGQKTASPRIVLHVKRKTTFYTVCLVLSMVLTSYMNTLVFLVPLQSGEKVSFLVTICVSTSVFVSYFTTVMPRGLDSVPNTLKLLIGVIVESLIVLLATIVVLRLFHQQQQPNVPDPGKPGTQEAPQGPDGAIRPGTRRQILNVKAERLDRVFFVLAFVGNTVFLAVLLYQSLSSTKTNKI